MLEAEATAQSSQVLELSRIARLMFSTSTLHVRGDFTQLLNPELRPARPLRAFTLHLRRESSLRAPSASTRSSLVTLRSSRSRSTSTAHQDDALFLVRSGEGPTGASKSKQVKEDLIHRRRRKVSNGPGADSCHTRVSKGGLQQPPSQVEEFQAIPYDQPSRSFPLPHALSRLVRPPSCYDAPPTLRQLRRGSLASQGQHEQDVCACMVARSTCQTLSLGHKQTKW